MKLNFTRTLYLIALAHLILELCSNFLPVVYPVLITTLNLTYTQVGIVTLVFVAGTSLTQPLFGYLSDRWSPAWIVVLSIFWIGVLMGLVGFAWNYLSLVLLVGFASLGSGAFHPAGAMIASAYSGSRRGTAISIFSVGGNLGSAISPLFVAAGISLLGLSGTSLLIPAATLFGLLAYQQLIAQKPDAKKTPLVETIKKQELLRSGYLTGLILIIIAAMSRSWFQVSLVTYLPEWMQSQGWSLAAAGQILSVLLVSISIGSLVGGVLSDRIGGWQVLALSLGLLGPAHWLLLTASGFLQIVSLGAIGVFIGATFPVTIVMAQEIWPRNVGLASALVMGLGWLPGGIGASVTGLIADQFSLTWGLISLIIWPLIGVLCIFAYAIMRREVVKKDKVLSDLP